MGSFKRPRAFDPLDLEIIDRVYEAAWASYSGSLTSLHVLNVRTQTGKREPQLGCLLSDLGFSALQEGGDVADSAPVLNPVAKREQVALGPFFANVENRLIGHVIHRNFRALSLASL
jgi:hypothetical protein